MEKNELIKKHRNIRIFSIFIMILSFSMYMAYIIQSLYFILFSSTYIDILFTLFHIYNIQIPVPLAMLPILAVVNLILPFILMFALYKQIFTLTKKNFLAFMDENALIFNLKTIKKNLFNLILVFFLFVSPFLLTIMILFYIYLMNAIKKSIM
ncbi:MAG: hypothetical protein ACP5KL_03610 [Thermoplasmata archaeon]